MKLRRKLLIKSPLLKIQLKIFTITIISLFLKGKVVIAQDFSNTKSNGWVVDTINILSPETESKLNQKINELQQQNGTEIIILTVPQTASYYNSKDFATRLLAYWNISQEHLDDAVLLVYSRGDDRPDSNRPYSIEFSNGAKVADSLPEKAVSSFMEKEIYPLLDQGKTEEAVIKASQGIINFLNENQIETNNNNGFINIIQNYYYLISAILGLSLIIIVVIALRKFSSSRKKNRLSYNPVVNSKPLANTQLKPSSTENVVENKVDVDTSKQPEVVVETTNTKLDDKNNLEVSNLEKSPINTSEKIDHNILLESQQTLVNVDFIYDDEERKNKEFIDNNIKHQINFESLEIISLDDLENAVNKFQNLTLNLFEFVKDQEEEFKTKCDLATELKEKLTKCSPVEKLILESKLQELQESMSFLEQTLVGQRNNLKKQQILLAQHLMIFNRRKTQEGTKSTENINYHKLENIPLNDLEKLVNDLEKKYLKLVDFVNAEEEELKVQSHFLKQLEEKLSKSTSITKSILEPEIQETEEVINLLKKTLFGQQYNLKVKQVILKQHRSVLNRRKIALNEKEEDQTIPNLNAKTNQLENNKNKIFEKKQNTNYQIQYLPQAE